MKMPNMRVVNRFVKWGRIKCYLASGLSPRGIFQLTLILVAKAVKQPFMVS